MPTPGPDGASSKKNKNGGDLFRLSHRIIFWWAKIMMGFVGTYVTLHLKKIFLARAAYVSTEKQVVLLTLFVHQT